MAGTKDLQKQWDAQLKQYEQANARLQPEIKKLEDRVSAFNKKPSFGIVGKLKRAFDRVVVLAPIKRELNKKREAYNNLSSGLRNVATNIFDTLVKNAVNSSSDGELQASYYSLNNARNQIISVKNTLSRTRYDAERAVEWQNADLTSNDPTTPFTAYEKAKQGISAIKKFKSELSGLQSVLQNDKYIIGDHGLDTGTTANITTSFAMDLDGASDSPGLNYSNIVFFEDALRKLKTIEGNLDKVQTAVTKAMVPLQGTALAENSQFDPGIGPLYKSLSRWLPQEKNIIGRALPPSVRGP